MYNNNMYNIFSNGVFYGFIRNTLSILTTASLGISISIVIVAFFINKKIGKDHKLNFYDTSESSSTSSEDEYQENKDEEKYEDRYWKEFENLENNDISNCKLNFIEDKTPNSIVKMSFDTTKNAFIYYTNNKDNLPYKYLETVARLFVINNDCKNKYINYEEELKKIVDNQNNDDDDIDTKNDEEPIQKKKDSVFAKFKNYKTNISNTSSKKWIIPAKANHYIYQGKLIDYELLENKSDNSDGSDENEFECLDYSTFKKIKTDKKNLSII
jgi:hypothetical protein